MKRREFVFGFSGLGLLGTLRGIQPMGKGGMRYRRLGRTGIMVSEIGLGGSPVPPEPVFRQALEQGVNYVDTSSSYMNGNSERMIGRIARGRQDRLIIATKFHPGRWHRSTGGLIEEAEGSLKRLNRDTVDILMVHGAKTVELLAEDYVLEAFRILKEQGKIRFAGVSCHHDPAGVLIPAIKSGHYDVITVAYNAYSGSRVKNGKVYSDYLQSSGIGRVLDLARSRDVGVIAMKTMAGGDRQDLSGYADTGISIPQAKLKWVLQDPRVSGIICEMLNFDHLDENLAVVGQSLSAGEQEILSRHITLTSADYCRMCGACVPVCPQGIDIPDVLRYGLYYFRYGKADSARRSYRQLTGRSGIASCLQCRNCEANCPYGIQIVDSLRKAARVLS